MDKHTVDKVHIVDQHTDRPRWAVSVTGPDGVRMMHVFPHSALLWRSVEYGIDPSDSRTLLDIVLHERFLTENDHHPAAPDFVFNTDVRTARTAHLVRIDRVKTRAGVVHDPDNLLSAVHKAHSVDPEWLDRAAEHVRQKREQRQQTVTPDQDRNPSSG